VYATKTTSKMRMGTECERQVNMDAKPRRTNCFLSWVFWNCKRKSRLKRRKAMAKMFLRAVGVRKPDMDATIKLKLQSEAHMFCVAEKVKRKTRVNTLVYPTIINDKTEMSGLRTIKLSMCSRAGMIGCS